MTWTLDLTQEGFNHYSDNVFGTPANVSDNDTSAPSNIQNFTYIAIDLGSGNAYDVTRLRLYFPNSFAFDNVNDGIFQGSNNSTDGTDGDWDTLVALSSLAIGGYPGWTDYLEFSNGIRYRWYRISGTPANNNTVLVEWELFAELAGFVEDAFGISDDVDAWIGSGYIEDAFGISDDVDATSLSGYIDEEFGIADDVDAEGEFQAGISDEFGIADEVIAEGEFPVGVSDELGIADEVDAFNWTKWLELNESRAIKRYYFTLTGAADSTTDLEIPISSFQATKRTGSATYLSVVIPDFATYSSEVAARPNGEMILEMAYILDGVESIREEIVRVDLETPTLYRGPRGRSIGLAGTRTQNFVPKNVALSNPSYQSVTDGNLLYRFPAPDPYLNPGDTLFVEDEQFTVDFITYIVSQHSIMMEVHEV